MRMTRDSGWGVSATCVALILTSATVLYAAEPDPALSLRVDQLLRQLNDEESARRDDAEQELFKLAPTDLEECDAFMLLLPEPLEGMPAEVRLRLSRVRQRIERRQGDKELVASRLTLSASAMDLSAVLKVVQEQTSNELMDYRDQFGQDAQPRNVTIEIENEAFWPAIDKILDATEMSLYPFAEEEALAVINREERAAPRVGRASYVGPFRIEPLAVVARRSLRSPSEQGASVELEIAWEPRLQPIALSQPAEGLEIVAGDGSPITVRNPEASFDVEVQVGSHATELTIPLTLPPRGVSSIASFQGRLSALVPGRTVEFRFNELDKPQSVEQRRGGVRVTLSGLRKNQALWEVHMRLQVESEEAGLESHRGWVFQNATYLLNKNEEIIDHAGFETTMQSEREIGLAYFFELPDDAIGEYTWVYRTPAAIVRVPVEYELKEIPLP
ncbi:MAG: hypothetical protein KDA57_02900 [Planctomycetales bacterium]|nr:hypothetical protein [Planctomycetales bacterium]